MGIRYQGCEEDCRSITIDKAFYSLPAGLQEVVRTKMRQMEAHQGIIYPHDWEKGFKKGLLYVGD
ncbi:MAG TPA: hypothetical protein VNW04_07265 [Puia sp.]|nr:hypothetical protein [Puia sp.]